jgi:hypothetical protein
VSIGNAGRLIENLQATVQTAQFRLGLGIGDEDANDETNRLAG